MNDEEIIDRMNELRKKHDLRAIKKEISEDRLKGFFNSIYPKFSITEIEKITGIPDSTLGNWFKELKIPFIRSHISNISIPGEENYKIIVNKDGIINKLSAIKITPELSYVIGFSLGDGSIQKYMVEVFNKDKNLRKVLFNYLKPYGTITEEERINGLWRLRLSSVKIANLIKDKNKIKKETIDYIFNERELARHFIAAFWDAEGSVRKQGNYNHVYLYNCNEYLINKICSFLNLNDIKFSIHKRPSRDKFGILNGREIKSKKTLIRISIPKVSVLKWADEIGKHMNHSKKREVVNQILNSFGGTKWARQ